MKVALELPIVSACDAQRCAYNAAGGCHARAISVGDGAHAACDTFFPSNCRVTSTQVQAGVGACTMRTCRHNVDYECTAEAIRVGVHADHADCLTFDPTC
ncbi:DUF1540 domain-containing protein [Enhygromyxa salina]|uniref:DUF1540 domain-containing protein n=1 Tax=Enhygromyxa salina TaxID=215803 RepID=A0A2S9XL10_9BACT|nr:DUF1540 domain-containing protein [Enhygromyxa salina]PRP93522.1 hypothetical protein ENSA7_79500 [Enhygromyxa salina]